VRHVAHGRDPLDRPEPPEDSRWQRGFVVDALYLADDVTTMWAEWYRHLAEGGLPPLAQLPRDVWRFRVDAPPVADLRGEPELARVGLTLPSPGRPTWRAFQRIGETLWREGWRGLLAPSAARPNGRILCLFTAAHGPRVAEPIPPRTVVREPPSPPAGMRT